MLQQKAKKKQPGTIMCRKVSQNGSPNGTLGATRLPIFQYLKLSWEQMVPRAAQEATQDPTKGQNDTIWGPFWYHLGVKMNHFGVISL